MTDTYQEVQHALDFAIATLGGHSNQGDACNALRGAKAVLNRLEVAHVAATTAPVETPVEVPDELKALIAEGAAAPVKVAQPIVANPVDPATGIVAVAQPVAAENSTVTLTASAKVAPLANLGDGKVEVAVHETLAQRIEHAVEGALGVASETVEVA